MASGIPIRIPGMTRLCGLCRGESFVKEYLVGLVPGSVAAVEKYMPEGTCGACGGKLVT